MRLQRGPKLGLLGIAFVTALVFAPSDSRSVYADMMGNGGSDEVVTVTGCVVRGSDGAIIFATAYILA